MLTRILALSLAFDPVVMTIPAPKGALVPVEGHETGLSKRRYIGSCTNCAMKGFTLSCFCEPGHRPTTLDVGSKCLINSDGKLDFARK